MRLAVLAAALLLGACAAPDQPPAPSTGQASAARPEPVLPGGRTRTFMSVPPPTPAGLLGATRREITERMGAAALDWREGRHAILQFVDGDCVIHAFIDGDGDGGRVAEVRVNGRADGTDAACRDRLGQDLTASN